MTTAVASDNAVNPSGSPEQEYPDENEQEAPGLEEEAGDGRQSNSLAEFIRKNHRSITGKIIKTYQPTYRPSQDARELPDLLRAPIGLQEQTIRGTVHSLKVNRGTNVVGEMGSGKSFISIAAARMAGFRRVLVLCPPHMVQKWRREVRQTLKPDDAVTALPETVRDMQSLTAEYGSQDRDRTLFVIMSREKAKLSHSWENTPAWRLRPGHFGPALGATQIPVCPKCGRRLIDEEGLPLSEEEVLKSKKRLHCLNLAEGKGKDPEELCNAPVWQASRGRMSRNRIGLAEYAKKRMPRFFDLLIADEVHEYKARDTAQGQAAATSANIAGRTLTLTGTLMGGYASTLFHLLYRFYPEFRDRFPWKGESQWVDAYGFVEETIRYKESDRLVADGSNSKRKIRIQKTKKEVPGLMPEALFHLIENTIFIRLQDIASNLPPYREYVITTGMDQQTDHTGWSQASAYNKLQQRLEDEVRTALRYGSSRLLGAYLQSLLSYPDAVTKGEAVYDPQDGRLIVELPPLDGNRLYPKEEELLRMVREERAKGRNCLVYVTHTSTRDITGRVSQVLEMEHNRVAVMKAEQPKPAEREAWIAKKVQEGANVLICNPKLVQTGLDLVEFPTIIWYETEYSVYTMRQASRRSWRIGQDQPVDVYYMTHTGCLQASALKLMAAKVQSSLAVEGELPEEGLSSYEEDKDNLLVQLARQVAGMARSERADLEGLEAEFRRARKAQERAETMLADAEEWKLPAADHAPEPEPEPAKAAGPIPEPALAPAAAPEKQKPKPEPQPVPATRRNGQMTMFSMEEFRRI